MALWTPRPVSSLLTIIVALAAIIRFWGIAFGLPHTDARPDERIIIDVAREFLSGNFSPRFFDYPWWYMWVLSAAYLAYYVWGLAAGTFTSLADLVASWPVHWQPFFLISRSLSAVAGTATVAVVFWTGQRLWGQATGLVAALFMALAFLHVRDSHFGTTDVMMTLFMMLSIALLVEAHRSRRVMRFAAAGLFGGLAAGTKYTALLLPLSMLASLAITFAESPGRRARALVDGRAAAYTAAFAAGFLAGAPFLLADLAPVRAQLDLLWRSMVEGVGSPAPAVNGWMHHLTLSLRHGMGLPLLLAGLAGGVYLAVREPKTAALLFAFPVAYFAVAGGMRNLFFRYAIPVVPFLCLAAAAFVCRLSRGLTSRLGVLDRRQHGGEWLAASLAVLVVLPSAISVVRLDLVLGRTDSRVMVAEWFEANVPPGSSVVQSGSIYGYAQFDRRLEYRQWMWDRGRRVFVVDGRDPEEQPDWILIQESPLPSETQAVVQELLGQGYELAWRFDALDLRRRRLYDVQDAFFVPYAGFDRVRRPGPNFVLYKRAGVPMP